MDYTAVDDGVLTCGKETPIWFGPFSESISHLGQKDLRPELKTTRRLRFLEVLQGFDQTTLTRPPQLFGLHFEYRGF